MAIIPLDRIKPGFVLLHDVKDRCGRLLLGEGSAITDRHLHIFKAWGVSEANVHDPEQGELPPAERVPVSVSLAPEEMQRARARAMELFRHADLTHPAVMQLYEISLHLIAREMSGNRHHGHG